MLTSVTRPAAFCGVAVPEVVLTSAMVNGPGLDGVKTASEPPPGP